MQKRGQPSAPRQPPSRTRRWRPAGSTSSAPSGTRAGASTTSCVAAPAVRAIQAARSSSCRCRTTSCASSAPSAWTWSCTKLGLQEGEAIIHPWINKALEKAQQKVEARNFDMRKNVLKYDNVMNDQRKVVFEQRREMMGQESLEEQIHEMRTGSHRRHGHPVRAARLLCRELGCRRACTRRCKGVLDVDLPVADWAKEEGHRRGGARRTHPEGGGRGLCRRGSSATAPR